MKTSAKSATCAPRARFGVLLELLLITTVSLPCVLMAQVVNEKREKRANPQVALRMRAEAAMDKKDFAAAVQALLEYVAATPADAVAHFELGYSYTAMQQWPEAEAEYKKAVELDPKMDAAQLNLGLVLLNRDPSAAIEPLRKAADLQPKHARPRLLLAAALERSGKLAEAVDQYQIAERLDANNFDIPYELGRELVELNRPAEAETEFRRALALRPDVAPARAGLAESLLAQNKMDEGILEFEAYLQVKPDDRDARLRLASILIDSKKYDQALAELEHLGLADQSSLRVYKLRAEIYLSQKRYDDAATTLSKAVALAPKDAELRARLGKAYLEKRDFGAAQATLKEALRLDPQSIDSLRDLMTAYYLGGNYAAALATLDLLEQRISPVAEAWFVRATCYDHLGRKEEALTAYRKFLALDETHNDRQDFQAHERARTLARELHKSEKD